MKNICFLFPGQGSQKVGMAKELVKISSSAKKVFETAEEVLKFKLLDICENSSQDILNNTKYSQPAIVATSIAAYEILKEQKILPNIVLGHSLGQYSALFAAGVINLKDTFKLIKIRSIAMKKACEKNKGAMYAILGCNSLDIEQECKKIKGYVICSNYNSPQQTIVSGEETATKQLALNLKNIAKKCVKLNLDGAFHSDLMKEAAISFKENIKNIKFNDANIPIYSNVTSKVVTKSENIKNLLIDHLVSPVLFEKCILNIQKDYNPLFIEVGYGKILTRFLKETLNNPIILNVQDNKSFLKTIDFLKNKY